MKATFTKFKNSIHEIIKYTTNKSLKELVRFFIEMIVIVLIIAVFKFPFMLIRDFGVSFVTSLGIELTKIILTIWNSLWDISYTLFGLYMFMKIVGNRYANLNTKK